jgi:hypothetical protein
MTFDGIGMSTFAQIITCTVDFPVILDDDT